MFHVIETNVGVVIDIKSFTDKQEEDCKDFFYQKITESSLISISDEEMEIFWKMRFVSLTSFLEKHTINVVKSSIDSII